MSQDFIQSLIESLPAQEDDIRIQIGRETVYRGQRGQEPVVNKLNESCIQLLEAALSAERTGDAPSNGLKGTINIDLGGDRVFRFAQGKVEINLLQEPERQTTIHSDERSTENNDSATSVAEVVYPVEPVDQGQIQHHQEIEELLQMLCFDLEEPERAIAALSEINQAKLAGDEERMKIAWTELYEVFDAVKQESPHLIPGSLSGLEVDELADMVVKSVWIDPPFVDVNKFIDQETTVDTVESVAGSTPEVVDLVDSPEPMALEASSLSITKPSPVARWLDRAKEQVQQVKVPAIAITAWEFHETNLREPVRQWLGQQFEKVKTSVPALEDPTTLKDALRTKGKEVGTTLTERGMQASRIVAKQLNNLPATIRGQQIAMAISRLVDTFGKDEGNKKIYRAEKYTLTAIGKQCTVSDSAGKVLFEFDQTQIRTANVGVNKLNGLQQSEFLQAGKQVKPLMEYGLQEDASQLMSRLGNLAPEGTKQIVLEQRHQQLVAVLSQSLALTQPNQASQDGMKFEGSNYTIESKDGALSLIAKDGRGEIFSLNERNGAITSQLTKGDVAQIAQVGQALMQIVQTAQSQTRSKQHAETTR